MTPGGPVVTVEDEDTVVVLEVWIVVDIPVVCDGFGTPALGTAIDPVVIVEADTTAPELDRELPLKLDEEPLVPNDEDENAPEPDENELVTNAL